MSSYGGFNPPALVNSANMVVSTLFPVLSAFAIFLRFKARGTARDNIRADDWWIFAAWILALPLSVNVWVFAGLSGIGHYKIDIMRATQYSLQCVFISSLLVQPALASVKIAILLFYKRIFAQTYKPFKIAVWIAISVVAVWGVLFFLLVLFLSDPLEGVWTGEGKFRYDYVKTGMAQVGSSVALDFLVLCFPLPLIWTLRMPTKKKVGLACIFWLGIFCCVAALTRTILLDQSNRKVFGKRDIAPRHIKSYEDIHDAIYLSSTQFVFMILEPHCSIIAACLPCYGPLVRGGVAPEWLLRSFRSIKSLASRVSSTRSGGSISEKTTKQYSANSKGVPSSRGTDAESQIELGMGSWSEAHHGEAQSVNPADDGAYDRTYHLGGRPYHPQRFAGGHKEITVTQGVEVTSTYSP